MKDIISIYYMDINSEVKHLKFKTWTFPGGEVGFQFQQKLPCNIIDTIYISLTGIPTMQGMMLVGQAMQVLHNKYSPDKITFYLPYLPYARQDRECNPGEAFSLRVFREFLKALKPYHNKIIVKDLHSKVSRDILQSVYGEDYIEIKQGEIFSELVTNYDTIIFPDNGASKKLETYKADLKYVVLNKIRKDGQLTYDKIDDYTSNKIKGKCLVVDDICDGGATFIALKSILQYSKYKTLDLAVTHGIFSKGIDELMKCYGTIYCNNLMSSELFVKFKVHVI